ncbi:MAG: alpha-mannosidase [Oscillospiraceae bacterium]|jgi:alpha-mannosidase|nr:alpha-mannosidase [Oscillospiraceae bacterium]
MEQLQEKTLYMIGNAHIDPVWLWRWQDGFSEIRATFRAALERMDETPGFIFTSASASYYEWVEKNDPELFDRIRARVKEGRWALAGGWWIQPDCNIPSGESFARQALYGQRYFERAFGVRPRTGYNVDSFGHSGSLPKILRKSGLTRYVYMRPGAHEMAIPSPLLRWHSPEGESVLSFRLPYDYCSNGAELRAHIERYAAELKDARGFMCFYGVGNHGGGPTRENLASIAELDGTNGLKLVHSSPDAYFDHVEACDAAGTAPLPSVTGDMLHHASGCYSAHSGVKRWNRQAENQLTTAEKWSVVAHLLLNKPYPQAELDAAWKKVLFNQFHDILAGTSLREAYEDAQQDFGFALSSADWIANDAMQAIMGRISIPYEEGVRPYVVFNTQAFDAEWPVSIDAASIPDHYALLDDEGSGVPYQIERASAASHGRVTLVFMAKAPALGYRVYRLTPKTSYRHERPLPNARDLVLENEWLRAEFSPETGALARLTYKPAQIECLSAPTAARVIRDTSDTWSHGVLRFDEVIGEMLPAGSADAARDVARIEDGPCRACVRVTLRWGNSVTTLTYSLYHAMPYLFVKADVDWQEAQAALKLRFPLQYRNLHVTAQAPFGYADRPMNGEEFPMQQWVDASGVSPAGGAAVGGLAILNNGKYSFDACNRAIHITALRSPYYANHEPFVASAEMGFPVIDQGKQTFQLALMPHEGAVTDTNVDQAAALLNAPPVLLPEGCHDGTLPQTGSLASVEGKSVMLDALKFAQDVSGEVILHLHETARRKTEALVQVPMMNRVVPLTFEPGQIHAVRIPRDEDQPAREISLTELED